MCIRICEKHEKLKTQNSKLIAQNKIYSPANRNRDKHISFNKQKTKNNKIYTFINIATNLRHMCIYVHKRLEALANKIITLNVCVQK